MKLVINMPTDEELTMELNSLIAKLQSELFLLEIKKYNYSKEKKKKILSELQKKGI